MKLKKYLINLFKRSLVALFFLIVLSFLLKHDVFYYKYKNILFASHLDFIYIKSKTKHFLGNMLDEREHYVVSEKLKYYRIEEYGNSYLLEVDSNYVINNLESGVVVSLGHYEDLGRSIVIEGDNGITYIYSNIENINVNLYDYIKKDTPLGVAIEHRIFLTFKDDDEYLSYEKYI